MPSRLLVVGRCHSSRASARYVVVSFVVLLSRCRPNATFYVRALVDRTRLITLIVILGIPPFLRVCVNELKFFILRNLVRQFLFQLDNLNCISLDNRICKLSEESFFKFFIAEVDNLASGPSYLSLY